MKAKTKEMVEIPDQKEAAALLVGELETSGLAGWCEQCDRLDALGLLDALACGGLMLVKENEEASKAYMKEIMEAAESE
jgi:hypothetical protein